MSSKIVYYFEGQRRPLRFDPDLDAPDVSRDIKTCARGMKKHGRFVNRLGNLRSFLLHAYQRESYFV